MQLFETERPRSLDGVIGQDKIVGKLRRRIADNKVGGKGYWISGKSGQGKTTIAQIIANENADEFAIEELDAGQLTPKRISEIEIKSQSRCIGGAGGWAFIVNESHGLTSSCVRQLLVVLERIPSHVVWIFTTTNEGEQMLFDGCDDSSPLISRCVDLKLTSQGLAEKFATHVYKIALKHNLADPSIGDKPFKALAKRTKSNMRAMLQSVENYDFV